jgi:hypothetical protein
MDMYVELDSCIQTSLLIFILVSASDPITLRREHYDFDAFRHQVHCQVPMWMFLLLYTIMQRVRQKKRVDSRNVLLKYEACQFKYKYEFK